MINKKYPWLKRTLAVFLSASLFAAGVLPAGAEDFSSEAVFSDGTDSSENAVSSSENAAQTVSASTEEDASDSTVVSEDSDAVDSEVVSGSSADGAITFSDDSTVSADSSDVSADNFSDNDASADSFTSGETGTTSGKTLNYILGRPMTEDEISEQLAMMQDTPSIEAAPDVESDLSASFFASYPETWDSRDEGWVTSVKNQNPYNICWAFSLASNFETSLLKNGLGTWDLSEEHLAYFFANRVNDPLGNTPNDKITHLLGYHQSGNGQVASFFLSTWSGMVTEDKVPLNAGASGLDESLAYDTDVYLEDAAFSNYWPVSNGKNVVSGQTPGTDRMKLLLTEYGSVSLMFYQSKTYYNAETAAYCCPQVTSVNHAVTVVGWDDNYSKDNFAEASGVQNDGAWIVKNSYGSTYGKEGYIYLSYEDATIKNLVCNTVTKSPKYPNNYFYDGASTGTTSYPLSAGSSVATIFTATAGNGKAEELGEVVLACKTDNAYFKIQIYTDLTDSADPTSGTLASEMEYYQPLAGIDTVELENPVTLQPDSRYSVVITLQSGSVSYYMESSTTQSWFSSEAGIEEGQSFYYSSTVKTWADLINATKTTSDGTTVKNPCCASIKAHTRTLGTSAETTEEGTTETTTENTTETTTETATESTTESTTETATEDTTETTTETTTENTTETTTENTTEASIETTTENTTETTTESTTEQTTETTTNQTTETTAAPQTYTVTYNSNTGKSVTGLPSDNTKYTSGESVKVKSSPYCSSLFFAGWNTRADGKGASYSPGKTFKITSNVTLYAQWKTSVTVSKLKYRVTGKQKVTCYGTTNKKLKTLKIPATIKYAGITYKVTTVWHNAFKKMTSLTSVTIGNNVTCIGKYAFYKCSKLKKVTIGTGLTWIRSQAFRGVKKGCTITIKSTKLKKVDSRIDQSTSKMVVKVPKKKLSAYKKLLRKKSKTVTIKSY